MQLCGELRPNFGIEKDTSNVLSLVWFSDLKFVLLSPDNHTNFRSTTLGNPKTGAARSNRDLMAQSGVDHAEVAGVLPLALPAPEMVAAILAGRQPLGLTASRLMQMSDLPLSWAEQRRVLGFFLRSYNFARRSRLSKG